MRFAQSHKEGDQVCRTISYPYLYKFVAGMLYPSVLGAAIIWLAQAAAVYLGSGAAPGEAAFLLATWFVVYHCNVYTLQAYRAQFDPAFDYDFKALVSDVVECAGLLVAFAALGYMQPNSVVPPRMDVALSATLAVPFSACIVHMKISSLSSFRAQLYGAFFKDKEGYFGKAGSMSTQQWRWALIVFATVLCCIGIVLNSGPVTDSEDGTFAVVLALWSLLPLYLWKVFGKP